MTKFGFLFIYLVLIIPLLVSGETPQSENSLDFFLDCKDCDYSYVKQELSFISFVRNPKLADVHILSSEVSTASGGRKYFLNFIGMNALAGQDLEYEYLSDQSATEDEKRKGLLQVIQSGILHYYLMNGLSDQIEIELYKRDTQEASRTQEDRWNSWIFSIETEIDDFEKEASQNEYKFNSGIEVEKITQDWKMNVEFNFRTNHENYYDDGNKISNVQKMIDLDGDYIFSLSNHWSAGIFGGYRSDTYANIKSRYKSDAGLEYNIFPWDVSNRKVFTLRYVTGVSYYRYNEVTIYEKEREVLFAQAVSLNLEMIQPWGKIEARLEGEHYFHDFSKNRLSLESDLSIRLTRQLSIYTELGARVIHNQLYLPKGDASLEDLLLRRRKLETTYEINGDIGFRYTFGSIYSSVVNERF